MAQTAISEFFTKRKSQAGSQPSKRRKVVITDIDSVESETTTQAPMRSTRLRSRLQKGDEKLNAIAQAEVDLKVKAAPAAPQTVRKSRTKAASTRNTRKKAQAKPEPKNSIKGYLTNAVSDQTSDLNCKPQIGQSEKEAAVSLRSQVDAVEDASGGSDLKPTSVPVIDEVLTASCDDHNASPQCTPVKSKTQPKRGRPKNAQRKDLFEALDTPPDEAFKYDFSPYINKDETKTPARKGLVLKRRSPAPLTPPAGETVEVKSAPVESQATESTTGADETTSTKMAKGSKDAKTSRSRAKISKETVENLIKKAKNLNPDEVRTQLNKSGKLAELQEKLKQYNQSKAQTSQPKAKTERKHRLSDTVKPPSETKAPAHERYHSLAAPVPATLNLPLKYKLLWEMFQSADMVVSMLHKRVEVCTFSKLKTAVQEMVRRQFDEKHLGQFKTVYPEAYTFRQEKNLPCVGGKISQYQLTVEANLTEGDSTTSCNDPSAFTATKLLQRKNHFHRSLITQVKKYHKEFLSSLDRPLNLPDSKITRWHPRFKLDQVPEVEAASLPEAPKVKRFVCAKDVLDHATVKLNPRVEAALKAVAEKASAAENKEQKKVDDNLKNIEKTKQENSEKTNKDNKEKGGAVKGVSMSLLERIRAKEAKKMESALTKTPKDEQRLEMLGRLPDVVRIIRQTFVTQKRPAITLDDAIQKVKDSSRSCLGSVEAEKHIMLAKEVLPDWLSVVSTRQGQFIKIDRNKELSVLNQKLQRIIRESQ